jgi:hypothetical protein
MFDQIGELIKLVAIGAGLVAYGHSNFSSKTEINELRMRLEDHHATHLEKLRSVEVRKTELDLAERELGIESKRQALKAEQDRDLVRHMVNMKGVNHQGKAFEELIEKDAEEAKAISEIFSGAQLESIKTLLVEALGEALDKKKD